ncbi:MAG: Sec-independent protein translocase protein TatC [Candidatus Binatia bacterium]|nr:MAG: Sec-independent protein translocase protein TatC [Candidatus Binatia bacterium]
MPLTAHLEELRWRILKSLFAVGLGFAASYAFSDRLFAFLAAPLRARNPTPVTLIGTGVAEAFFTKVKVGILAGIFFASPVILYQAWQFVAPGLFEHEKRYARPFVAFGTLFFLLGAAFCYLVIFPVGFAFFLDEFRTLGAEPAIRMSEYLTFSSRLLLAFGVTFELPVATFFLARIGLVDHRTLLRFARYAVVLVFVVAAVLTPPDVVSQFLMAVPLLVLYFLSVGVAYVAARNRARDHSTSEPDSSSKARKSQSEPRSPGSSTTSHGSS